MTPKAKRKAKRPADRAATRKAAPTTTRVAAPKSAGKSATKTSHAKKAAAKIVQASRRDAIHALVEAGAKALGLPLDPAWQASVAFNLQLILRHAARVDEFILPDDAEPAPVYYA